MANNARKPHIRRLWRQSPRQKPPPPVAAPPPGLGKKPLRPHQLRGLPEEVQTENPTDCIQADWETFKYLNPQYEEDLQWKWFKEVRHRYGIETSDSDWPYWTGSQP